MTPLIDARQIRYSYGEGSMALDGVDFSLYERETVALLGPNGSGKTTFVLHVAGILRGQGEISVCGMAVTKENLPRIRAKVGIVFQDSEEQLFLPTVLEDVAFGPRNLGMAPEEATRRARQALDSVGMLAAVDKAPYHLSAGEKRRAALAGVLAMQPEILVLDEPAAFLDPPAQRDLILLLQSLSQAKILVTHDTRFARALATRAVFLDKGKIIASGSIDEIVSRFDWQS